MIIQRSHVLLSIAMAASLEAAPVLTIRNAGLAVEYDPATASVSVRHLATGRVFARDGKFGTAGGKASVVSLKDPVFGTAEVIEIVADGGNRNRIALYPGLPFALVSGSLHNGTGGPVVHNKVPLFSAAVETGAAPGAVRTLGTGGLLEPAKNPGSYAFLTIADPVTRSGVVGGWITHDRGSGVVFSPVADGVVGMKAQVEYGRLRIKPGTDAATETFALGWFADARLGMEAYADAIARVYSIRLPRQQAGFCTWYMEKNAGACDEVHLPEVSAVAARELKPYGFDFVQIDDQWQDGIHPNGPKKDFTTHAPKGPYPGGMKKAADRISQFGLVPGIWFMPFAGTWQDPHFKDHQDWFVRNPEGKPYETAWGGTCLDMTNPEARDYVRGIVHRIAHDWGYKFFKMDGYWTGSATKQVYVNNGYVEDGIGDATFLNPDKTNIEALRDGTRLVREAAGPGVFLLGCCVSQNMRSFGGTFGLLDAMRIGPDTGGDIGAPHGSRLWFLNGRVWWNDPDCVFVRKSLPVERARLNASWTAIAGQLFYTSDWMPETPPERLDIVKRCIPAHGLPARPVDVFESDVAKVWILTDTRQQVRRDVVALYNWGEKDDTVSVGTARAGLPAAPEYVAFDFWADKFVAPFRDRVSATLPGRSCRILAVRPVAAVPQLLSTSRHVTQGIVDVTGERWDAGHSQLTGSSKVVGGDPYELRIILPVGEKSWKAVAAEVSPEDAAAGVRASFKQDGPKLRAVLTSPAGREVEWRVRFEPAKVAVMPPPAVANAAAVCDHRGVTLTWTAPECDTCRIVRDDGTVFESSSNTLTDTTTRNGVAYRYEILALGWGGLVSDPVSVEVTSRQPERPATPPVPTVHLGDLKPLEVKNGWGSAAANREIGGGPLRLGGKTYAKGVGAHANAVSVYPVPAGAGRFVAVVGIDDSQRQDPRSSVVFQIWGDVKEMGEKPALIAESPVLCDKSLREWAFNVELNTRFKEIRLVVTDAGDGIAADHADWVDAGFVVGGNR